MNMTTLTGTTAVILAGGLGTRLRSVVADRPKVMAEVWGKPFLAYLLEQVAGSGVQYVVLCVGYASEQIQAAFGNAFAGMELTYSQESTRLDTAGALRLALPQFRSDSVLVMNGDSFCEVSLGDLWNWHNARQATGTLVLVETPNVARYGSVAFTPEGKITGFQEKRSDPAAGWINGGLYLLGRALIEKIPAGRAVSLEKELFPAWIEQGLYGYRSLGRFLDIGTPETYAQAEEFFAPQETR
jgi:D-glycero-alpha-D-manno-heptose 1-phosphate guanylyltransferase